MIEPRKGRHKWDIHHRKIDPFNVGFFGPDAIMFQTNAFADFLQETLDLGLIQAVGIGHEIPPKVAYPGMWQMKSLPERDLFTRLSGLYPIKQTKQNRFSGVYF